MVTLRQLAAELGRSSVALIAHYKRLKIKPKHRTLDGLHGNNLSVTPEEADRIRESVRAAKRGRPHGAKDSRKRRRRSPEEIAAAGE